VGVILLSGSSLSTELRYVSLASGMEASEERVRAARDPLRARPDDVAGGARRDCEVYRVLRLGVDAVYFEEILLMLEALRRERSGGGREGGGRFVDVVSVRVEDMI
jgi:hypothetical protein